MSSRSDRFRWRTDTAPFTAAPAPSGPVVADHDPAQALFVVEQVSDRGFALCRPFVYQARDGAAVTVTSTALGTSDLASVPRVLAWFVGRHGRHTPAALLHDQLVDQAPDPEARQRADDLFLEAMDRVGVPPVRARVMWTAVTFATRWSGRLHQRLGILAWLLAVLVGHALLGVGLVTGAGWPVVVALIAPGPASLLWGRRHRAGLVAGAALWVVAVPFLATVAGYAAYWLVEQVVRLGRTPRRDSPAPVPYDQL